MMPHPEKLAKGGEDALYASRQVMAVADGVGGWTEMGIDPAKYSRKLCTNIQALTTANTQGYLKTPLKLLTESWQNNKEVGSSTLVVVTLPPDEAKIYASYVGDSGYTILRKVDNKWTVVFTSKPQQRRFNFPLQLGWGENGDHPNVALSSSHDVQHGDIVILGTDGLYDNLSAEQILAIVSQYLDKNPSSQDSNAIADAIVKEAFKLSLDTRYNSPFAKEALLSGFRFNGGKSDDISVTVGIVQLISA